MPECQVTHVFSISALCNILTTSFLAYQMPYRQSLAGKESRSKRGPAFAITGNTDRVGAGKGVLMPAGVADELKMDVQGGS
jgi:hypothetical protein